MSALGLVSFLAYERREEPTAAHLLPRLSPLSLGYPCSSCRSDGNGRRDRQAAPPRHSGNVGLREQ
jgi:hypothetical protein